MGGGERAAHLVLESFPNTQNREQININKGNISSIVPVGGEEGGETQPWAPPLTMDLWKSKPVLYQKEKQIMK